MRKTSRVVARWLAIKSERGVTAIEYVLIGTTLLGVNLNASFSYISGIVEPPSSGGGGGGHGGHSGHGGHGGRGD